MYFTRLLQLILDTVLQKAPKIPLSRPLLRQVNWMLDISVLLAIYGNLFGVNIAKFAKGVLQEWVCFPLILDHHWFNCSNFTVHGHSTASGMQTTLTLWHSSF